MSSTCNLAGRSRLSKAQRREEEARKGTRGAAASALDGRIGPF